MVKYGALSAHRCPFRYDPLPEMNEGNKQGQTHLFAPSFKNSDSIIFQTAYILQSGIPVMNRAGIERFWKCSHFPRKVLSSTLHRSRDFSSRRMFHPLEDSNSWCNIVLQMSVFQNPITGYFTIIGVTNTSISLFPDLIFKLMQMPEIFTTSCFDCLFLPF